LNFILGKNAHSLLSNDRKFTPSKNLREHLVKFAHRPNMTSLTAASSFQCSISIHWTRWRCCHEVVDSFRLFVGLITRYY